jgi:hypothetical protein
VGLKRRPISDLRQCERPCRPAGRHHTGGGAGR